MKDIQTKEDVQKLVDSFYIKVQKDEIIGHYFTSIANVDWSMHLPKMYQFWETLLFGTVSYKGNPMAVHFPVNAIEAIEKRHFEHWIALWTQTVHENFEGETAELAIYKAKNIANLMAFKMETATRLNEGN